MTVTIGKVYQDDRLIVLDKPSGLLAVPGRGEHLQDCLSARVQHEYPTALVVHRLDRDTSGIMVMAFDADTQRELSRQFAARETTKLYIAVVAGSPAAEEGFVDLPLRKDFDNSPRHRVDLELGKAAQTRWRVLHRGADRATLEVEPVTGRSHQIRIHLAEIGHPILGDPLYGDGTTTALAPRLMLHAARLTITHPDDGRRMTFEAACPFWRAATY